MKAQIVDSEGCPFHLEADEIKRDGDWLEVKRNFQVQHIRDAMRGEQEKLIPLESQNPLAGGRPIADRVRSITVAVFYKPRSAELRWEGRDDVNNS